MPKIDRRNVYQQAIERWGIDSQVNQLIEECAELIVALNHARRVSWDGAPADHVVEELADVEIMLEQMRMISASAQPTRTAPPLGSAKESVSARLRVAGFRL